MQLTIKAIETRYKGYRFRSRLEARWAVFFDAIGWLWDYEPEGFEVAPGVSYLPDFRLDTSEGYLWVEVKPKALNEQERKKAELFVLASGDPLMLCVGVPEPTEVAQGLEVFVYQDGKVIRSEGSPGAYAFHKWGRIGWCMGSTDYLRTQDIRACDAARGARFEHGESGVFV